MSACTSFIVTSCAMYLHTPLEHMPRETDGGGNVSRTAKRAAARENKVCVFPLLNHFSCADVLNDRVLCPHSGL